MHAIHNYYSTRHPRSLLAHFLALEDIPKPALTHSPIDAIPSLLLNNIVTNFPKGRRASRSVRIEILIEPVPKYTPRTVYSTNLHAFAPPPLLTVENAKGRPANVAVRCRVDTPCNMVSWGCGLVGREQGRGTSNLGIGVRVPGHVHAARSAGEVHDRH